MTQIEVHISDIRTFRSCRRRWNWSSRLRQNLERIVPYAPFFTGKAIHAALEFYYQDAATFEETLDKYLQEEWKNVESLGTLWPMEVEKIEEQIELIYGLLDHYRVWAAWNERRFGDSNLEFLHMEYPWELPMPDWPEDAGEAPILAGRFDGVVRQRSTGAIWIYETKTTRSIEQFLNTLPLDEQCTLYTWAAKQVWGAENVGGVLYNLIRKKPPQRPSVLRSGELSKAKSIDTTHFYYMTVIKEHFPDWSDETIEDQYGEVLEALRPNEFKFFLRNPVVRSDEEIAITMDGLRRTALEMLNREVSIYPSPSWSTCSFCTFKSACLALSQGSDYQVLLDAEYQVRESATSMRKSNDEEEDDVV